MKRVRKRSELGEFYDLRLNSRLVEDYYRETGYLNFGYWMPETKHAGEASENLMEQLVGRLDSPPRSIVDVACGAGATTAFLAARFPESRIVGINISEQQLAQAHRRVACGEFLKMDAAQLGFEDDTFDLVICVEAAFHFKTRERFLEEALRVLRPGGALLISDVIITEPDVHVRPWWHRENFVQDSTEYAEVCRRAGFTDVRVVDATEACWTAGFWRVVRFAHGKFLGGELSARGLALFLERVYRLSEDLDAYLLVSAVKPNNDVGRLADPVVELESSKRVWKENNDRPRFEVHEEYRRSARDYDSLMYWPALQEYYGHSDFVNYGCWDRGAPDAHAASKRLVDRLLEYLPEKHGNLLDVACGKGATTRRLTRHYPADSITGINISERQLASCRDNAPGCRFLKMNAAEMTFPDAEFDNMICVEAAFHFSTRERFLKEAHRVLRPGGRLVLSDILLTRDAEARRPGRHVENFIDGPEAYAEMARQAGFGDVEVVDATEDCFVGGFWHLVRFSHERLLDRRMNAKQLQLFLQGFFEFVPEMRYYLLASLRKT